MQDLERVRYVTENYRGLQGLRTIPFGFLFVILGAVMAVKPTWFVDTPLLLVLLLVGVLLSRLIEPLIQGYYERRFGRVEPDPEQTRREWRWSIIWFVAFMVGNILNLSLSLSILIWAMPLLVYTLMRYWPKRRYAMHQIAGVLVVGGLMLLVFLNIIGWAAFFVACGLIEIGTSIIDHMLLVRTFKPVPGESNGASI